MSFSASNIYFIVQRYNTIANHALALVNYISLCNKFSLVQALQGPSNVYFCHALKGLYLSPFCPHTNFSFGALFIFKQGRVTVNRQYQNKKQKKLLNFHLTKLIFGFVIKTRMSSKALQHYRQTDGQNIYRIDAHL